MPGKETVRPNRGQPLGALAGVSYRAIPDVLKQDAPTGEDGVAAEQVDAVRAMQGEGEMPATVLGRLDDLDGEASNGDPSPSRSSPATGQGAKV